MNFPNFLTLLRIALAPVLFSLLVYDFEINAQIPKLALIIFTTAIFTDVLDGFFARFWNQQTYLGAFLDPLADKILIVTAFLGIVLTRQPISQPPLWLTGLIFLRELVILCGFFTFFWLKRQADFSPNRLGKITAACQMALIAGCLVNFDNLPVLGMIVAALTMVSCVVYTWRGIKKLV